MAVRQQLLLPLLSLSMELAMEALERDALRDVDNGRGGGGQGEFLVSSLDSVLDDNDDEDEG